MSKISKRINTSFQAAIVAKQEHSKVIELKQQIDKLDREAQEREQLVAQLRFELERQSGKCSVAIDRIRPSQQCRNTFPEATIKKRCESLQAKGQLEPLILIVPQQEDDFYWLEDGEITWRAAKKLVEAGEERWRTLNAVFSNFAPQENIHRRTLIHHLHSESLTPLDRAEAVVKEIMTEVNEQQENVVKLLRNLKYRLSQQSNGKQLLEQVEHEGTDAIASELLAIGLSDKQVQLLAFLRELQINFSSFVANDLDMILLADNLKLAAREQNLGCHQAKYLNRLQAKKLGCSETEAHEIRSQAIASVLEDDLSKNETAKLVSRIMHERGFQPTTTTRVNDSYQTAKDNLSSLQINQLKPRQLKSLQKIMEAKLTAITRQLKALETK